MNEELRATLVAPAAPRRFGLVASLRAAGHTAGQLTATGRRARRNPLAALAVRCSPAPTLPVPAIGVAEVDLDVAIETAVRTNGARGVVDVLAAALVDARVAHHPDLDTYLDRFKSACRQTRRYRDAIPVFTRLARLVPQRADELAVEVALAYAHLGDRARASALLAAAIRTHQTRPEPRPAVAAALAIASAVIR